MKFLRENIGKIVLVAVGHFVLTFFVVFNAIGYALEPKGASLMWVEFWGYLSIILTFPVLNIVFSWPDLGILGYLPFLVNSFGWGAGIVFIWNKFKKK